jgi:hypothetical protein
VEHGIQSNGGRIDDGATEAPGISVDGLSWEEGISSETARQLADPLTVWGCLIQRQRAYVRLARTFLGTVGVAARRPGAWGNFAPKTLLATRFQLC